MGKEVGVKGRTAHHGQNLTGLWIHAHHSRRIGMNEL